MFRLIALLLAIIMSMVSVAAVYYNKAPLLIDFYIIQFTNIPLGISLFLSMMFGILIATFFITRIVFSVRSKYKHLKKDHELISKEGQILRISAIHT